MSSTPSASLTLLRPAITGVHGYVPDDVLTNADLARIVDTSDAWITERTGIKERRILRGEGKGPSHMAAEAVRGLLRKTMTDPKDVDLVIVATTTPDYPLPATAALVCDMTGIPHVGAFDLQGACSGFLYGLSIASQFVATGKCRKAIVIGAEKMTSIADYTDRTTCVLFGDGAGAVMVEPSPNGFGVIDTVMHSDGAGMPNIQIKAGGSRVPASPATVANRQHYFYQEGAVVYKHAVARLAEVGNEIVARNQIKADDIDWVVPHQANRRIIEATADRLGVPMERVMMNIAKYGNTSAATIPLCLWDYEAQLKAGQKLVMVAFGGGFTWAGAYVTWAYDGAEGAARI